MTPGDNDTGQVTPSKNAKRELKNIIGLFSNLSTTRIPLQTYRPTPAAITDQHKTGKSKRDGTMTATSKSSGFAWPNNAPPPVPAPSLLENLSATTGPPSPRQPT